MARITDQRSLGAGQGRRVGLGRRLRAEHGRGARLLHDVLDRAAAVDRDLGRRAGLRRARRRAARSSPAGGPDGDRARGHAGLLESVRKPAEGASRPRWSASLLLLIGATSVFGELQDALDRIWRAPVRVGPWDVGLAPGAPAVVRHDPGHRLPADGVAGGQRGTVRAAEVVGAGIRRLGECRAASSTSASSFVADHRGVRDDLQDHAARADRLAGRLDRRRRHLAAVHGRQVPDRPLHRQERHGFGLRRRRRRSSSCWSGSTTRRRSSCSARSSPGHMRTSSDPTRTPTRQAPRPRQATAASRAGIRRRNSASRPPAGRRP